MKIQIAGENALIIYFAEQASPQVSALVQQAQQLIEQGCHDVVIELVPSYASLLIHFDLFKTDHHHLRIRLRALLASLSSANILVGNVIELPAYYHESIGPELALIAKRSGLSINEVIALHQARDYRVYAIGFAPGFAYLGDVEPRIATPRLATPRTRVPRGAIGIADQQTAVYPSESPGGWNILGLCPIAMFDINANPVMPIKVGDSVRFVAIDKKEFLALGGTL